MNRPQNEHFHQLLHAYELGMLTENEEEEFELLLMEYPEYFERVERLDEATLILRYDPAARATIGRVLDEKTVAERAAGPAAGHPAPARKFWPRFLPMSLAAAAVLLIMILANWEIDIHPTPEAVAVENRLAVMSFENLSQHDDARRLGEIAASLLITDLSESRYVQVISSQRLYDLVRSLGKEAKVLDRETALQVAREAQARWMLTGSILQVEPYIVIAAQLINIESGTVTAAQRVTGQPDEDIFAIVDKLTVEVKNDLALPRDARNEPDRSVAEVTTHSREAYRCYLEGLDLFNKYYFAEAARSFEQAVEYDTTFAMAYYYLARTKDMRLLDRAVRYAEKAGHKEQIYIRSLQSEISGNISQAMTELEQAVRRYPDEKEFYFNLGAYSSGTGAYDTAIARYNQAIAIDPRYKTAYNSLAYAYLALGDVEQALKVIDIYISLAPDEANPYDSRGEICAQAGLLDLAIESFRTALKFKPDYEPSLLQLAALHLYRQDYRSADSCFQALAAFDVPGAESRSRYYQALIPLTQGKFQQALRMFGDGIAADSATGVFAGVFTGLSGKHFAKANIYAARKNWAMALQEIENTIAIHAQDMPDDRLTYRWYYGQLLAESGQTAKAYQVADEVKVFLEEQHQQPWGYWYVIGAIRFSENKPQAAVDAFTRASTSSAHYYAHYMLARAYLAAGNNEQAAAKFEAELAKSGTEWRLWLPNWRVEMHYYLGLAYEHAGRLDEAAGQYRTFLDIWKDADPGIEEVQDAKARLTALEQSS